jgi:hypothetical protein
MNFIIETYKLKDGTIVFDYPEYLIYKEPFIKGSDDLINYRTENAEFATIQFSNYPIQNANAILHYHHSEEDGEYYIDQLTNMDCYLCPALFEFFEQVPRIIFAKITAKNSSST